MSIVELSKDYENFSFENKSVQQRSNEKVFKLKIKYNLYFTDVIPG